MNWRLAVAQLTDSALPNGAFSHSFGLESYIADGVVHDEASLLDWLLSYLRHSLTFTDALAIRFAFEAASSDDIALIAQRLAVTPVAREVREAAEKMGRQFVKIGVQTYGGPWLADYSESLESKGTGRLSAHPAIAFALICRDLGATDWQEPAESYLLGSVTALTQNGVRAIPLGQMAGQRALSRVAPMIPAAVVRAEHLDAEDLGASLPGIDIAQMRHEHLRARMFMS